MWPDRVSNSGPPTYESGALPIALRGPATDFEINSQECSLDDCLPKLIKLFSSIEQDVRQS